MNIALRATKIFCLSSLLCAGLLRAEPAPLEQQLEALNLPDNQVSPVISQDKLFILNTRYSSLSNRHEVSLLGGNNFNADSHMVSQQGSLTYRYHLNPRWSVGLRHTEYYNELSAAGKKLFEEEAVLPDTDYAKSSDEIFVNYHLLYGKLRITQQTVTYFDQYFALGYGQVDLAAGKADMWVADVGLAFWIGSQWSARLGLKNEFYQQQRVTSKRSVHNANGYLEFGYLFGRGNQ